MTPESVDERGRTTILLDEPPPLGAAYARALARPARVAMGRLLRREHGQATAHGEPAGRSGAADPADDHRLTLPAVRYRWPGARVMPDRLAAYREVVHEVADGPVPAGYVHVMAFPVAMTLLSRDDFPLPLAGLVHVANAVTVHRAIDPTETLTIDAWATDLRPHRRGTQVDVVVEASDGDGATVWEGTSTYLARGVRLLDAGTTGDPTDTEETRAPGAGTGTDGRGDGEPSFPLPTARWELGADVGRRYARVSGDVNPIHLSPLTAKMFGFPRTIAHGMYTASRALAAVGREHGDAFTWTVGLARPVLLPGAVAVSVRRDQGSGAAPAKTPGTWVYEGWDPVRGTPHFRGDVTPLDQHPDLR